VTSNNGKTDIKEREENLFFYHRNQCFVQTLTRFFITSSKRGRRTFDVSDRKEERQQKEDKESVQLKVL
jgi:hypothetical protein